MNTDGIRILVAITCAVATVLVTNALFGIISPTYVQFYNVRTAFAFHPPLAICYEGIGLSMLGYAVLRLKILSLRFALLCSAYALVFAPTFAWNGPDYMFRQVEPLFGIKNWLFMVSVPFEVTLVRLLVLLLHIGQIPGSRSVTIS